MKQKIFFKKNGKCSSLGLWLVNRTELSLAFVAVGRVVVTWTCNGILLTLARFLLLWGREGLCRHCLAHLLD